MIRQPSWTYISFILILFLTVPLPCQAVIPDHHQVIYKIDFTNIRQEPSSWLRSQGFSLEKEADKPSFITIDASEKGLLLNIKKPAMGMFVKDDLYLENVTFVRIEWGVDVYPVGASWEKGVNREPLMISLSFGGKVNADRFFLPDIPYFIGMFLCQDEPILKPYIGNSYRRTGRYICLDRPEPGITIISFFEVGSAFQQWFNKKNTPPITGLVINVDTSGLANGKAEAHLRKISFYTTNKR